jgi:hypothetical protein
MVRIRKEFIVQEADDLTITPGLARKPIGRSKFLPIIDFPVRHPDIRVIHHGLHTGLVQTVNGQARKSHEA